MNWKHLLDLDKFSLVPWKDYTCGLILDKIGSHLSDILNNIQEELICYLDSQKYLLYLNHRKDYDYISCLIKDFVNRIDLKKRLNFDYPDINIDYEGIKIALINAGEEYISNYFMDEDYLLELKAMSLHYI